MHAKRLRRPEETLGSIDIWVRSLHEGDIEKILLMSDLLGLSPWTRQDYLDELRRNDSHLTVAQIDERLAGFLAARRVPGPRDGAFDMELYNIGVRPEHQRAGVGQILMHDLIAFSWRNSVSDIWLEVRRKNSAAIAFYLSFGFAESGIRRGFYQHPSDDAVTMRLELGDRKS
jgi:[ribosomal protein S18]-alanine N-acetyltransferase